MEGDDKALIENWFKENKHTEISRLYEEVKNAGLRKTLEATAEIWTFSTGLKALADEIVSFLEPFRQKYLLGTEKEGEDTTGPILGRPLSEIEPILLDVETEKNRRGSVLLNNAQVGLQLPEETISFNVGLFLEVVFIHTLWPFTIPIAFLLKPKKFVLNQGLIFTELNGPYSRFSTFVMQTMFASFFFINLFLFAFRKRFNTKVSDIEVILGIAGYFAHRLVVGTKYALMTEEQINLLKSQRVTREENGKFELATGWANPTIEILDGELRRSATRFGIDLEKLHFYVHPESIKQEDDNGPASPSLSTNSNSTKEMDTLTPRPSTKKLLFTKSGERGSKGMMIPTASSRMISKSVQAARENAAVDEYYHRKELQSQKHLKIDDENDVNEARYKKVVGLTLAVKIIREMMIKCHGAKATASIPYTLALLQGLLPGCVRLGQNLNFLGSYNAVDIYLTLASIWFTFFFVGILYMFIQVGIADYYRRFTLLKMLGRMIDPCPNAGGAVSGLPASMKRPQFIDLTIPHNVTSWFALRQVLVDLGFQYRERITLYTSYVLLLAMGLTGTLLYQLFVGGVLSVMYITVITFLNVCILLPIAVMTFNGTSANEQFDIHVGLLMRIRFTIRELLADDIKDYRLKVSHNTLRGKTTEKQLQSCDSLIGSVLEILMVEKTINPIRILGLPASYALVRGIGSVAAGAVASGVKLFSDF